MSVNVDVRDTLISMGIDRAKATQAAKQFSGVDGAINWVFSDAGEKVSRSRRWRSLI
jgi:hypothetical protein